MCADPEALEGDRWPENRAAVRTRAVMTSLTVDFSADRSLIFLSWNFSQAQVADAGVRAGAQVERVQHAGEGARAAACGETAARARSTVVRLICHYRSVE